MLPILVQEKHPNAVTGVGPLTVSFTVAKVRALSLVVLVACNGDSNPAHDITGVTAGGDKFTLGPRNNHPNDSGSGDIWYLLRAGGGYTDLAITVAGNNAGIAAQMYEFWGPGMWSLDMNGSAGTNAALSGAAFTMATITPTGRGNAFVAGMNNNADGAITGPADGYSSTLTSGSFFGGAHQVANDAQPHGGSWNGSSTHWQTVAASFKFTPWAVAGQELVLAATPPARSNFPWAM